MTSTSSEPMSIEANSIKQDFPIFKIKMNGKPLTYLDSTATSQRPNQVIDAVDAYYKEYNANIHRGIYQISERASEAYDESKRKVAKFINAESMQEIIYLRNATEALNLVALAWGDANISKGDHILISEMEHHSNIVPWIVLAKKKEAVLDYIKLDAKKAKLDMGSLKEQLEKRPKIVSVTHASNVLGTINNVREITKMAHGKGAVVLIDGAQSAPHMEVDVGDIDCDFYAFSGHKMLAPTGIGVLYGKEAILDKMEPLLTGGEMIKSVEHHAYSWNDLPWKFEAGTSNISGGIGLGAAVDYLSSLGMHNVREHEKQITRYALEKLSKINGVTVYGPDINDMDERGGVISFAIEGIHPHDVSQIFDSEGIAIRSGHHCAMPLVTKTLAQPALSRMSFYIYNNESDVDKAIEAINKAKKIFKIA
ncbi:MAG: cysteine desulfurase [Candidatus Micrarchaeota archaeon]|nr:cysteine desulfurase [Candidatus Micrarchaeota archaeon]